MLEFRKNSGAVIKKALRGKRMLLTYRGKPVIRLEPVEMEAPGETDPFYRLADFADSGGKSLTNAEMDELICSNRNELGIDIVTV